MFGEVQIWDVPTKAVHAYTSSLKYAGEDFVFSPDDSQVFVIVSSSVRALDTNTGNKGQFKLLLPAEKKDGLRALVRSPDHTVIAGGYSPSFDNSDVPGEIHFWDSANWKEFKERRITPTGGSSELAFSPDGRWLASGGYDMILHIWDAATGKPVAAMPGHAGTIRGVTFSPDGKIIATASDDGDIILWNVPTNPGAAASDSAPR